MQAVKPAIMVSVDQSVALIRNLIRAGKTYQGAVCVEFVRSITAYRRVKNFGHPQVFLKFVIFEISSSQKFLK